MNYILVDQHPKRFYPLTLTRPVAALRVGFDTIADKWERVLKTEKISYLAEKYLQAKFKIQIQNDNVLIDSTLVPDDKLAEQLLQLQHNQALIKNGNCLALRIDAEHCKQLNQGVQLNNLLSELALKAIDYKHEILQLNKLSDMFTKNQVFLSHDFKVHTKGKKSEPINDTNTVLGKDIFVKKGAKVSCSIFNTETGPIFIDKDAEVMEGCMLRGPLYIGKGAVIKMGAKVYGPTTIGPECRVGGEVSNSVMQGYSNKGHDGFMGNSILGEWCNLGADTNTSNLKNNYGEVKLWDYEKQKLDYSGLQFCGLLMGDHSKAAINTQFNTGTSVGVMSNVFQSSFPDKYIPSFLWLGDKSNEPHQLESALKLAAEVMHRRHVELSEADKAILTHLATNKE